jgi:hypothetical protein
LKSGRALHRSAINYFWRGQSADEEHCAALSGAIISTAASFDEKTYKLLEQLVAQPASTDPEDSEIERISSATGVSQSDLRYFLSFLSFLFAQTEDTPPDELKDDLASFINEHGNGVDAATVAERLAQLLVHRDVQLAAAKRRRLSEGFLPNLLEVAHFVDLRSDFERNANCELTGKVIERIPVIQLSIRTNSMRDHESGLVLQLDADAIDQLQSALDEIKMKIEILRGIEK